MVRSLTKLAALAMMVLYGQSSWGFALLGPNNEAYQVPEIGYNPLPRDSAPTGPKNIGEQYRRNTPVMYYSFDANFLDYFGSNGVAAIDSAFAILNSLPRMSQLSSNLSEYPLQVTRENYLAETLSLYDLKSHTLHYMIEQMGLAEPERYVWTLHDRYQIPGPVTCPQLMEYAVIQRNFDPVTSPLSQFQSSAYVNGTLYTYYIQELCGNGPPVAEAVEVPSDPLDFSFTAVAAHIDPSPFRFNSKILFFGNYYTGLTRDDVGGLRYLYRTNLMAYESTGPNTLAEVTNPVPQILFTSNLTQLAQIALTNNAATLQTLFPNLSIIDSSNYFVNVLVTNVTPYFTNQPWMPVGSSVLLFTTNVVPTIQTRFVHTFGNVLVVEQTPSGTTLVPLSQLPAPNGQSIVTVETDQVGTTAAPFGPAGSVVVATNSTFTTFLTNSVVGDYVVLPTNWCSVDILSKQLTFVTQATNFLAAATNSFSITNSAGFTNAGTTLSISQNLITYYTNQAYVVLPVLCVSSNLALFQGMDHLRFVRRDFDSLIGRTFIPTTNNYVLNSITNNSVVPQRIQRTIASPDFLFSAQDLTPPPDNPPTFFIVLRSLSFNTNSENQNLAGPGTIEGPTTISFNKVGPIYLTASPNSYFVSEAEANQVSEGVWGSFDGTTNLPVVYPNGTSIANLENQVLIGISPGRFVDGNVGVNYAGANPLLTATGGQAPYRWSLASGSAGLPPGLYLSSNGAILGTPTAEGTYDFTITLTDAGGRTVNRGYSITISP